MTQVDAIYQGGVLKPLTELRLRENQRVRLEILPAEQIGALEWLERAKKLQAEIISSQGYFPDSTPDIAEDRLRDV